MSFTSKTNNPLRRSSNHKKEKKKENKVLNFLKKIWALPGIESAISAPEVKRESCVPRGKLIQNEQMWNYLIVVSLSVPCFFKRKKKQGWQSARKEKALSSVDRTGISTVT